MRYTDKPATFDIELQCYHCLFFGGGVKNICSCNDLCCRTYYYYLLSPITEVNFKAIGDITTNCLWMVKHSTASAVDDFRVTFMKNNNGIRLCDMHSFIFYSVWLHSVQGSAGASRRWLKVRGDVHPEMVASQWTTHSMPQHTSKQ